MAEPDHVVSTRKVYDFSATQYASAVGTTVSERFERPLDRAVLAAFAEEHRGAGSGVVLDVGCGVGRVTSYLYECGLNVRGVDLSPQMISIARAAHPHLTFDVAPMTHLPIANASIAAAVLWYSIIHTPVHELAGVWTELARVLAPNGQVLLGFQAGGNRVIERVDAYGSSTTMTWFQHDAEDLVLSLERAGFVVTARIWRRAEFAHETSPQAFLVAQLGLG